MFMLFSLLFGYSPVSDNASLHPGCFHPYIFLVELFLVNCAPTSINVGAKIYIKFLPLFFLQKLSRLTFLLRMLYPKNFVLQYAILLLNCEAVGKTD